MLKLLANYISLTLLLLAFIIHIIKLVYLFYKPMLLQKIKMISNEVPSKIDLALYYILTIGSCYYAFVHVIK